MKINFDVKREFIVNGKKYNSVEEMPPELREVYERAVKSGVGATIEKPHVTVDTRIVFNGKEYDTVEAMPLEVRRIYQSVMKSVEIGQASPELLSAALGDKSTEARLGPTLHHSAGSAKPIEPTSSVPRWILGGLALLILIFVGYYLLGG